MSRAGAPCVALPKCPECRDSTRARAARRLWTRRSRLHRRGQSSCREQWLPTAPIIDRTPTAQHSGEHNLTVRGDESPAALYFMVHGARHVLVRRHAVTTAACSETIFIPSATNWRPTSAKPDFRWKRSDQGFGGSMSYSQVTHGTPVSRAWANTTS
jgi:hypothetical protein